MIFNLFRRGIPKIPFKEVLDDPRTTEEKERDYRAEEIRPLTAPVWVEKPRSIWRKFPIFDQDQSGSCVGQSVAKLLGIENHLEEGKFVHLSARDIYSRRSNKPMPGMWFQNAMEIGYKYGATIEQLMPSQKMNEGQMNNDSDRKVSDEQIALVLKGGNYVSLPINIDAIASIYPKPIVIGVKFWYDEYNRPDPKVLRTGNPPYHHAIAKVDYTIYNGKRCLVIDDSWGLNTGWEGQRVISEDWFKSGRISAAWYFEDLRNDWRDLEGGARPKHRFDKDLVLGMRNNDVIALQDCLKWENLFPTNQTSTGYYGGITAKAVLDFWIKYGIATQQEIDILQGKRVGVKTRARLNELFS